MEDVKNGSCLFPRFQISVATGDREKSRASLHLTFWANYLGGGALVYSTFSPFLS